jgi:hypothetical protein
MEEYSDQSKNSKRGQVLFFYVTTQVWYIFSKFKLI